MASSDQILNAIQSIASNVTQSHTQVTSAIDRLGQKLDTLINRQEEQNQILTQEKEYFFQINNNLIQSNETAKEYKENFDEAIVALVTQLQFNGIELRHIFNAIMATAIKKPKPKPPTAHPNINEETPNEETPNEETPNEETPIT